MKGKTVIITGGNAGIGKETAKEIAKKGAKVILACRNLETARKARDEIVEATKNQDVIIKKLDLSSQNSIRAFVEDILKTEGRLDVLLHNAGMLTNKIQMSEDKLELTMATNHFGPFLLTHLLIDLLKKSAPSRIIVVTSIAHYFVSINLDSLNSTSSFIPFRRYFISKLANILFTKELARRLDGTGVTANCLHPGIVNTRIWEGYPAVFRLAIRLIAKRFFKNPVVGCRTSVYVACSEEVKGITGKYFSNCKEKSSSSRTNNQEKAKKLWEISQRLTNLKPTDPKI